MSHRLTISWSPRNGMRRNLAYPQIKISGDKLKSVVLPRVYAIFNVLRNSHVLKSFLALTFSFSNRQIQSLV